MRFYKIANDKLVYISSDKLVYIMSAEELAFNAENIKMLGGNVISIRDSDNNASQKTISAYKKIDAAEFDNIYIATFDDVIQDIKGKAVIVPKQDEINNILSWAKQKWEENHGKFFVHCTAGISRSSAIGVLINQMIKGEYHSVLEHRYHSPNTKVLEYGEKHLGISGLEKNIKKELYDFDQKRWKEEEGQIF